MPMPDLWDLMENPPWELSPAPPPHPRAFSKLDVTPPPPSLAGRGTLGRRPCSPLLEPCAAQTRAPSTKAGSVPAAERGRAWQEARTGARGGRAHADCACSLYFLPSIFRNF